MLAHLLTHRVSPLWTFYRSTIHRTIYMCSPAHSHWMMSADLTSLQLPAFPQTIQALAEREEQLKTDQDKSFWKFPRGCWLSQPRQSPSPAPKPAQEHKYQRTSELIGKQLRNVFLKSQAHCKTSVQHLLRTGFSLQRPSAAAPICTLLSTT